MANQISGQITVTTAGTAVPGPSSLPGTYQLQAASGNTGTYCYVGNDGADDVSSTTGLSLKKGGVPVIISVSSLDQVYFDSDTNGDIVEYIRVAGAHGNLPNSA